MKKLTVLILLALLASTCLAAVGCGNGDTEDNDNGIVIPESGGIDVLGSYTVRGISADKYHITPYPDNTYVMTYNGTPSRGTYSVSGETLILKPEGGSSISLQIEEDGDVLKQTSPDNITWKKITAE